MRYRFTTVAAALAVLLAACAAGAEPTDPAVTDEAGDSTVADDDGEPEGDDETESGSEDPDGEAADEDTETPDGYSDPPVVNGAELSADRIPASVGDVVGTDEDPCDTFGLDDAHLLSLIDNKSGIEHHYDVEEVQPNNSDESDSMYCAVMAMVLNDYEGEEIFVGVHHVSYQAWRFDPGPDDIEVDDQEVDTIVSPAGSTYMTGTHPFDPGSPEVGDMNFVRLWSVEHGLTVQVAAHHDNPISDDLDRLAAKLDSALAAAS